MQFFLRNEYSVIKLKIFIVNYIQFTKKIFFSLKYTIIMTFVEFENFCFLYIYKFTVVEKNSSSLLLKISKLVYRLIHRKDIIVTIRGLVS